MITCSESSMVPKSAWLSSLEISRSFYLQQWHLTSRYVDPFAFRVSQYSTTKGSHLAHKGNISNSKVNLYFDLFPRYFAVLLLWGFAALDLSCACSLLFKLVGQLVEVNERGLGKIQVMPDWIWPILELWSQVVIL